MEENEQITSTEQNQNVARAAAIVSLAVMGSRLLGLAREMAIFYYFKTKLAAPAFHLAFRIPNFLRDMFGEGILSKAFITTFIATETEEGEAAAWDLANRIFNLVVIVLTGIVVLGIVFSPAIVDVLARENFDEVLEPGKHYGFDTKVELTIYLTQLMFPYLLFVSLAAIAMGLLNSKDRFGIPACASSFFNLSSLVIGISGYYLFQRIDMHPTTGMAVGVLVGGMLQFLIQVPSMYRVGYRYRPLLSFTEPRVVQVLKLVGPAILGVAAVPINQLTNTWFITSGDEWLAWIQGAYRIMHFPLGIFGVAISTVVLPQLAKYAHSDSLAEFRDSLSYALRLMLTVILPASIGLMILAEPICRLLYERGEFTDTDTVATANVLFVYAFGLCGFSALKIITDGFYAFKDIRAPVIVSLCGVALNICMNYMFIFQGFWLNERAIVFSTVTTVTLNSVVLLFLLRRRINKIGFNLVFKVALKVLCASVVMGMVCWVSNGFIEKDWLGTEGIVSRTLNVFLPIGFSVLTLAGMYKALKVSEFDDILNIVKQRFQKQMS
ncbi:murein biosynthesis integral membrane protein MurJ [Candidatus Poribacteria bacterium]|nr:murein biosynthesis integral membrane protein MurJ [Candidatus Poribacteria bacterium]MYI95066.1 murein biosynthesis integral membrane protein MurJ [Candidatus Poribacteria bacterium]